MIPAIDRAHGPIRRSRSPPAPVTSPVETHFSSELAPSAGLRANTAPSASNPLAKPESPSAFRGPCPHRPAAARCAVRAPQGIRPEGHLCPTNISRCGRRRKHNDFACDRTRPSPIPAGPRLFPCRQTEKKKKKKKKAPPYIDAAAAAGLAEKGGSSPLGRCILVLLSSADQQHAITHTQSQRLNLLALPVVLVHVLFLLSPIPGAGGFVAAGRRKLLASGRRAGASAR